MKEKILLLVIVLIVVLVVDLLYLIIKNIKNAKELKNKIIEGAMLALMTLVENFINNGEAKKAIVCNLIIFIYKFIASYFKIVIPTYDEVAIAMEKVYTIYKDGIKNNDIKKQVDEIKTYD